MSGIFALRFNFTNNDPFVYFNRMIHLNPTGTTSNIVFKLNKSDDDEDMGLGNLLFIFAICFGMLISVVCVTFFAMNGCNVTCPCVEWCTKNGKRRHLTENYKFSLLSSKSKRPTLFEDEFEDEEAEDILFTPTLKRKNCTSQSASQLHVFISTLF